jgi:hypothetical protein
LTLPLRRRISLKRLLPGSEKSSSIEVISFRDSLLDFPRLYNYNIKNILCITARRESVQA